MIILRNFFSSFLNTFVDTTNRKLFIYIIHIDKYNIICLKPLANVVSFTYTAIE